jgi:hypothetical protein
MKLRLLRWAGCAAVLLLVSACQWLPLGQPELFDHAQFSFTPLAGWQAHAGPAATGKTAGNYLMMNMNILAEANTGSYTPRVTISSRALPAGSNLEQEVNLAYSARPGSTRAVTRSSAEVDGAPALVQRYEYPLGEPWYDFSDTWVVKNGQVYLVACQTKLNPSDSDLQGCQQILNSLRFK